MNIKKNLKKDKKAVDEVVAGFIALFVVWAGILCFCVWLSDSDERELNYYVSTYHECPECHWNDTGAKANITEISGGDYVINYFYCPVCGYEMAKIEVES